MSERLSVEQAERHVRSVFYFNSKKFYPSETDESIRMVTISRLREDVRGAVAQVGYARIRDGFNDLDVWVDFRKAYEGQPVEKKAEKPKKSPQKRLFAV